jgi:anaerobic ribonucleoside-triphosphate reductase
MFFKKIKKRDGSVVDFDSERIKNAVHKALLAVELGDGEKANDITKEVVKILQDKFIDETPSVEEVQDKVVAVLIQKGYEKVALEYQDFRKKKEELRVLREKLQINGKCS